MRDGCARSTGFFLRGGVTTLFAALNTTTGEVIGSLHRRHHAVEFEKFLAKLDKEVPADLDVHLICDSYATHKTPASQKWLLAHPRFHIHFTPTSEPARQTHTRPGPPAISAPPPASRLSRRITETLPPRPRTVTRPQKHPTHPTPRRAHRRRQIKHETEEANDPTTTPHGSKIKPGVRLGRVEPFLTCMFARPATWWHVTRYTLKRNVCGPTLTCGGAPSRALTWDFLVGIRWLPTAVYGCPAD